METAIECRNISKKYKIGRKEPYLALSDIISESVKKIFRKKTQKTMKKTYLGFKRLSFEVKKRRSSRNNQQKRCRKTTLLKILSKITYPTEGYAIVKGKVGSLLEVGIGSHPELTVRENIYLYGTILGMKKSEIDKKFDEIVAFSEFEKFIDTPVKYYSSRMYVRLAFSVAAHLSTDILLVDEVLAGGCRTSAKML